MIDPIIVSTRSRSIHIAAPPRAVFEFATTVGNWTKYHPGNTGITGLADKPAPLGTSFIEHARLGDNLPDLDLEWIVKIVEPGRRWVVELGASPWNIDVDINYEFESEEGGTRFTRWTKFSGTAEDLAAPAADMEGNQVQADDQYLENLKVAIESR